MGRDIAGLRIDKKSDVVSPKPKATAHSGAHVSPKALPENDETKDSELENQTDNTTHHNESDVNGSINDDEQNLSLIHDDEAENSDLSSAGKSRKQMMHPNKGNYDDEDNCSVASSTTSARTSKFKVTVPVAPRFVVDERLERRKEFYTKLEEKHKALDKEKREHEARIKEEEEALIKQLRKTMVYKANPVPSFYKEGPPPKVELRKLPVTRPKSPNLTRRKSCSDATRSSPDIHSVGSFRDGKNSSLTLKTGVRKSNGTLKKSKECVQKHKEIDESTPSVTEQQSKETDESHGVGDFCDRALKDFVFS